jgi:heme-degrading monooxygenase HmoA
MYLRLLHLRVKPGKRRDLREFFQTRVMDALAEAPGARHAALLEGVDRCDEWLSATFWKSFEDAERYEASGVPETLLEEAADLLEQEKQWKVELQHNLGVEYESAMRALETEGFSIEDAGGRIDPRQGPEPYTYVRIVSIKADPEKIDEFKRRWEQIVMPALREVSGCRFAFLSEGLRDRHHMLSVTIWDNQQVALKYEVSGRFDALTRRLQDTLAADRSWKAALGAGSGSAEVEPRARGYEIVAGGRVRR